MTRRRLQCSESALQRGLAAAVDIDHLKVSVLGGTPYIQGSVFAVRDKKRAEEVAESLCGGMQVVNQLRVVPQLIRRDETIAGAVRERLHSLPGSRSSVRVRSRNGVVQLTGQAESWTAREELANAARLMHGVVSVVNHIRVKGPDQPARETERQIKNALRRFLFLNSVTVKFHEGRVILRGTVPTLYHRRAAEDLVRWFSPVREIINGLVIPAPLPFLENNDTIHGSEASVPSA